MNLRPLHDRLLIKAVSKEEVTSFGIIIPDTAGGQQRPDQGGIIAAGPGKMLENGTRQSMTVKVGDKVVFKKYASDEVKIGNDTFLVIAETDVIAVIEA